MLDPAPTEQAAQARVRRALHDRRHAGIEPDLDDRAVRALAAENDYGPWVERDGRGRAHGGRRDTLRWRVRLAAVAARSMARRADWSEEVPRERV